MAVHLSLNFAAHPHTLLVASCCFAGQQFVAICCVPFGVPLDLVALNMWRLLKRWIRRIAVAVILPLALIADALNKLVHILWPGLPDLADAFLVLVVSIGATLLYSLHWLRGESPGACVRASEPVGFEPPLKLVCLMDLDNMNVISWQVELEFSVVSSATNLVRGVILITLSVQVCIARCCLGLLSMPVTGALIVLMITGTVHVFLEGW